MSRSPVLSRISLVLMVAALAAAAPGVHAAPPADGQSAAAPASSTPVQKVDLNAATEEQLVTLPKVGPALAKRILEYRKQVGQIRTLDELVNVKGIGEKTLEILRPHITVAAPSGKPGKA